MDRMKLRVNMYRCVLCKGAHARWWLTSKVRPPSCEERIRIAAKGRG
jgi:hypothetical protein